MRIFHTDGRITDALLDDVPALQLKQLQTAVGGWIEAVPGSGGRAYCNEEGRLRHLPLNVIASTRWKQMLVGDVVELTPAELSLIQRGDADEDA